MPKSNSLVDGKENKRFPVPFLAASLCICHMVSSCGSAIPGQGQR